VLEKAGLSSELVMIDCLSPLRREARHRSAQGRSVWRRLPRLLALLAVLGTGCGGDDHPPPAPAPADGTGARLDNSNLRNYDSSTADERDAVAGGSCTPGSSQECRVYLPAHDGLQPCFVGEQRCVDSHWGECADALLVDANNDDAAIDPDYP
jgi:hypothetical protein